MLNRQAPEGYAKISKTIARKLYNKGVTLILAPCNTFPKLSDTTFPKFWVRISNEYGGNFDAYVNQFEYFNCNSELGYYSSFYVKKEELKGE